MKIVHISSTDIMGGAARAAFRIHRSLRGQGVDSWMLVQEKYGDDPYVIGPHTNFKKAVNKVRPYIEPLLLKLIGQHPLAAFTPAWLPSSILPAIARLQPDIVHLHWIGNGQLAAEQIRQFSQPVVWTLHDMWPMTGGCHYAGDCNGYVQHCGGCPILPRPSSTDLSYRNWKRKSHAYATLPRLTLACPSQWIRQCAGRAGLLSGIPSVTIPYPLDTTLYAPSNRDEARTRLRLPSAGRILMFSASDPAHDHRKGAHVLLEAMTLLHQRHPTLARQIIIAIVGCSEGLSQTVCPVPIHYLGRLTDDLALASCYAAADLVVAPSLEDNLPNVVMEALSCGIPVVGSRVGGIPDLVVHGENGFLVPAGDANALAIALADGLTSTDLNRMGRQARTMAISHYDASIAAAMYLDLYRQVSAKGST